MRCVYSHILKHFLVLTHSSWLLPLLFHIFPCSLTPHHHLLFTFLHLSLSLVLLQFNPGILPSQLSTGVSCQPKLATTTSFDSLLPPSITSSFPHCFAPWGGGSVGWISSRSKFGHAWQRRRAPATVGPWLIRQAASLLLRALTSNYTPAWAFLPGLTPQLFL